MKRFRIIPILLIQKGGLVKSVKFAHHKYIGDPINAVKIFNEKGVDEIAIIDISATAEKRGPNLLQIKELASEAFMPMAYGGGITTVEEMTKLISSGVEKVIINNSAFKIPALISEAAKKIGSQSVVVSIDVKKNVWGKYKVYTQNGTYNTGIDPVSFAQLVANAGAGEIILNSIEKDGTFEGYDLNLIEMISLSVNIPLVSVGGAATVADFAAAVQKGASAVAAGSMFVFQRPHRAVLISYPSQQELKEKLFN